MVYVEALLATATLAWLAQLAASLKPWKELTLASLLGFLTGFAAARAVGVDNDSPLYEVIFDTCRLTDAASVDICQVEPGFYGVAALAHALGGLSWLQLLMALLALAPKLVVWQRLRCLAVAVPMYFMLWYPLHEMTQTRTAVATGLTLMGCLARARTGRWVPALPWLVGAVLFHVSALIVLPTLWLFERRPGLAVRAGLAVGAAAVLWLAEPVLGPLLAPLTNSRQQIYLEEEISQSLIGAGLLYQILFYLLARWAVTRLAPGDARDTRMVLIGLSLLEMSLVSFFMFSSIPAFQLRFTQLLFSLGLTALALPLSRTHWPVLAWIVGMGVALPFFAYNYESELILRPYQTAF